MVDFNRDNTLPRDIVDEMKESYLNYSMSVIVSRALPDVRDGLKLEASSEEFPCVVTPSYRPLRNESVSVEMIARDENNLEVCLLSFHGVSNTDGINTTRYSSTSSPRKQQQTRSSHSILILL